VGTNAKGRQVHVEASQLNTDLRLKAKLYDKAEGKLVEAWQGLRNEAAHGKPGFGDDAAKDTRHVADILPTITQIRAFIVKYPA
jgi:hypothetical protein